MIVVADTTPINYLILIQEIDLLQRLFGSVIIPPAVFEELSDAEAPTAVRAFIASQPSWLEVRVPRSAKDRGLGHLDKGEQEAIALAEELGADQLLMDETEGRREAQRRNLPSIGTLGVLRRASQFGWIDLPSTLIKLHQTTVSCRGGPDSISNRRRRRSEAMR
jgi:predicted nucleic acid-binding protein